MPPDPEIVEPEEDKDVPEDGEPVEPPEDSPRNDEVPG